MNGPTVRHPFWCIPQGCDAAEGGSHRGRVHQLGQVSAFLIASGGRAAVVLGVAGVGLGQHTAEAGWRAIAGVSRAGGLLAYMVAKSMPDWSGVR